MTAGPQRSTPNPRESDWFKLGINRSLVARGQLIRDNMLLPTLTLASRSNFLSSARHRPMNATTRNSLLTAVLVTLLFPVEIIHAAVITVPPSNWIFQNTEPIAASDVHVGIFGPGPFMPDIHPSRSSGGSSFPNLAHSSPGNIVFNGPPGIPSGGFYGLSFTEWPAGTSFQILFSYPDTSQVTPGRVYKQVGLGLNPSDFEFVAALSSELFAALPADFEFSSNNGRIAAISEPATLALISLAVASLVLSKRRKA